MGSDVFGHIVDLDIDDQSLGLLTAIVGEDNGLCLVVINHVVSFEDELGAAHLALRWAADIEAEGIVLLLGVLERPAGALPVLSAPVTRHLQGGRVAVLETEEVVAIVAVADDELGLGSGIGGGNGGDDSESELFEHC